MVYYFLRQFCIALDRCHSICGRLSFPFGSDLFCLFFKRFLETTPTFVCQLHRLMTEVGMHMWGVKMPKRGQSESLTRIYDEIVQLLGNADDHIFVMVPCPYVGLDW